MNALIAHVIPENVVPLVIPAKPKSPERKRRFKIIPFINPSGEKVWRVSGVKADGSRVRENFSDENAAECRQTELDVEYLQIPAETTVRATRLTDDQLRLAEDVIRRMGDDWPRLGDAADHFKRTGAQALPGESPRIDDAIDQYLAWLAASDLREITKKHFRNRLTVFKNSVPNARLAEVTPDTIWEFMDARKISDGGKLAYRSAISAFFSWCLGRPRRWLNSNPCQSVKIKQPNYGVPDILSLADCKALLSATEAHKGGKLAPYTAVCLFGGLRPDKDSEAAKLTWGQVNLDDGEILLTEDQTKTEKSRVVKICDTLAAWLKAHLGKPFYPANFRKDFAAVKLAAGLKDWTPDVMRHTSISHFFRQCGSYGLTAEQFGNSEEKIKKHYQGRVSSEDTKRFYAIMPTKGGGR